MEKKGNNLETIFQGAFKEHSELPSPKVLRQLKQRLWVSDFFSFKLNKPNIVYTSILAGAIIIGFLLLNEKPDALKEDTSSKSSVIESEKEPGRIISTDKFEPSEKITSKNSGEMLAAFFNVSTIEGCAPLQVEFDCQKAPSTHYSWDFGNGDKSEEPDPSYIYTNPGIYKAVLTVTSNGKLADSYSREIQVFEKPVASAIIDIENSDNANRKVLFINKSNGGSSYVWNFGDNKTAKIVNPLHTYDHYGIYDVQLIAIAANGCSDTSELSNQFLKNDYQLIFPYTFKPNTTDKGNNGFYESNGAQSAVFYPKNYGVNKYHLSIRANNGMEVFSTNNIKQGWNGYIRDRVAPGGIYSYTAIGTYPNGKSFQIDGKVKIIIEEYFQD